MKARALHAREDGMRLVKTQTGLLMKTRALHACEDADAYEVRLWRMKCRQACIF